MASRTSAAAFERRSVALPVIARELGIDAALRVRSGTRTAGWRYQSGCSTHGPMRSMWSREFDRDAAELMQLPQDVARAVAVQLRVPINEPVGKLPVRAVDQRAQEEYLLGRYLLWKVTDEDDRRRAIEHFERAISIAPDYAAPYAGLAHAWWMRGVFGPLPLHEVTSPARDAARKALALDDRLAEAYAAEAYVQGMFDWDWTGAEKTIQRAVALEPNSVDAHYVHAMLLMAMGRLPDALVSIERAAELDPLSAQVQSTFGRILYRARRFDAAAGRLRRAIELEPRNGTAYSRLADVYSFTGHHQEALQLGTTKRAGLGARRIRAASRAPTCGWATSPTRADCDLPSTVPAPQPCTPRSATSTRHSRSCSARLRRRKRAFSSSKRIRTTTACTTTLGGGPCSIACASADALGRSFGLTTEHSALSSVYCGPCPARIFSSDFTLSLIRSFFTNGVRRNRSTVALNVAGSSNGISASRSGRWPAGCWECAGRSRRVLVADQVVIAGQHQRRRGDGFERLQLDVRLLEHHAGHLQLAPALRRVSLGRGIASSIDLTSASDLRSRRLRRSD